MPSDAPPRPNGNGINYTLSGLNAEVLGPASSEAAGAIYSQMALAVGLAMQNIVSQQQTMNTINNAIATKALNMLAEKDPAAALAEIRKQFDSATSNTVNALSTLSNINTNPPGGGGSPPAPPAPPAPNPQGTDEPKS